MSHLSISIVSLLLIFGIIALIRKGIKKKESSSEWDAALILLEVLLLGFAPFIGIEITDDPCGERPFDLNSLLTTKVIWSATLLAYFVSRFFKKYLSPAFILLVSAQLVAGIVFCAVIIIHFSGVFIAVLIPGLNLIFLSPFFCLFFLYREARLMLTQIQNTQANYQGENKSNSPVIWKRLFLAGVLAVPIQLLIQAVLYLFGQKPDSLISQFTDSCGFLLSQYQSCSCGGGHYLCSIAANGNKKLVKPTRYGVRENQRILVNRQLLIANAFENWLEEHCPRIHAPIRKLYDSCGIPVNAWSKRTRLANLIYVIMKPLEWFFLLWLYSFDKSPETRIYSQYLPKEQLKQFIHEKLLKHES